MSDEEITSAAADRYPFGGEDPNAIIELRRAFVAGALAVRSTSTERES